MAPGTSIADPHTCLKCGQALFVKKAKGGVDIVSDMSTHRCVNLCCTVHKIWLVHLNYQASGVAHCYVPLVIH
jgi:hypothetical protein